MSEQTREKRVAVEGGQADLANLHASKDLHTSAPQQSANAIDLSSTSLATADIVRVVSAPQMRRMAADSPQRATLTAARGSTTTSQQSKTEKPPPGIIRNPFYTYAGDPVTRFITFLANILKFLEHLLLRLLGFRDGKAIPNPPQKKKEPDDVKDTSREKDKDKKKSEDREGLRIHRA